MEIRKASFQPDLVNRDIPSDRKQLEIPLNMDIKRSVGQFDLNDYVQIENLDDFVLDWSKTEGYDKYFPIFNFKGIQKMNLLSIGCFID